MHYDCNLTLVWDTLRGKFLFFHFTRVNQKFCNILEVREVLFGKVVKMTDYTGL